MSRVPIWTFNYDPDTGQTSPIATTCAPGKFGYPNQDDEDRTMYENTHYLVEADAWTRLIANADAAVSHMTSDYRRAQENLRAATDNLAKHAAFAAEVHAAHEKFKAAK